MLSTRPLQVFCAMPMTRTAAVETLFAQICRATPDEARDLAMLLTAPERADLALVCYGRTHTREQGRAIASACTRAALFKAGGEAGLALFDHAADEPDAWGSAARFARKRVSLAG